MALALMLFLCYVSYLVERMRDYTSLCSSRMDASRSAAWAPKFLVHPYVSCLIILSNIIGLLLGVWNLAWSWHKSKQLVGEVTEMCPKVVNQWWQGLWADLGRCLSPQIACDFTPEQAHNPDELAHHLKEGCLA